MLCAPMLSALVAKVAVPLERVLVPRTVLPSMKVTVPVGVPGVTLAVNVTEVANAEGVPEEMTAVVVGTGAVPISQIPRPWVATRRTRFLFWMAMSKPATRGSPVAYGFQAAPPLLEKYTPISVAAYTAMEKRGTKKMEMTGTSGMPVPEAVQVGGPPLRLVVFHTCC